MSEVTTPYEPGTPCWVDLMVPDQQAALDFYGDLFGWSGRIGPPGLKGSRGICQVEIVPSVVMWLTVVWPVMDTALRNEPVSRGPRHRCR